MLKVCHVQVKPQSIVLHIPGSKTDQIGQGCNVELTTVPDSPYCPVAVTKRYLLFSRKSSGWMMPRLKHTASGERPSEEYPLSYSTALADLCRLIQKQAATLRNFRNILDVVGAPLRLTGRFLLDRYQAVRPLAL